MSQEVITDRNGPREFNRHWLPHRAASDIWTVHGLFHEYDIPQAVYAFRASVQCISAGLGSFTAISAGVDDLLHNKYTQHRTSFASLNNDKHGLLIDNESILFGDSIQLLREDDMLALCLRLDGNGLDLRLGRQFAEMWYDEKGQLPLSMPKQQQVALNYCYLPRLDCGGRYYGNGPSIRVAGVAAFHRAWGKYPLRHAETHWEHFYLFFDNGDEANLYAYPYGKRYSGSFIPANSQRSALYLQEYQLEAIDYLEVDEWRFASGWRLSLPFVKQTLYLIPLIKQQYALPVAYPVLGIFDKDGNHLGYGLSELMPGARNELDVIGLKHYVVAPIAATAAEQPQPGEKKPSGKRRKEK